MNNEEILEKISSFEIQLKTMLNKCCEWRSEVESSAKVPPFPKGWNDYRTDGAV